MGGIQVPETRHVIRYKDARRRVEGGGETRPVEEIKKKKKWYKHTHTHTHKEEERDADFFAEYVYAKGALEWKKKGWDEPQTA